VDGGEELQGAEDAEDAHGGAGLAAREVSQDVREDHAGVDRVASILPSRSSTTRELIGGDGGVVGRDQEGDLLLLVELLEEAEDFLAGGPSRGRRGLVEEPRGRGRWPAHGRWRRAAARRPRARGLVVGAVAEADPREQRAARSRRSLRDFPAEVHGGLDVLAGREGGIRL
jgi:hypothetical protein